MQKKKNNNNKKSVDLNIVCFQLCILYIDVLWIYSFESPDNFIVSSIHDDDDDDDDFFL